MFWFPLTWLAIGVLQYQLILKNNEAVRFARGRHSPAGRMLSDVCCVLISPLVYVAGGVFVLTVIALFLALIPVFMAAAWLFRDYPPLRARARARADS